MNNKTIVKLMTSLIQKKFYPTKEEAAEKLDVYFALNRISEDEYAELAMLAEEKYAPPVEIPPEDIIEPEESVE